MKRFLSSPFLSSLVSTILIKLIYETRVKFRHYIYYVTNSYIKIVFVWLKLTLLYWSIHKLELKWAVHIKKELCKQFLSFQVSCFKTILPLFYCWIDITSFEIIQKDQFYYLNIMVNVQCTYFWLLSISIQQKHP